MRSLRKRIPFFIFCAIATLFAFLRLYKLDTSLEFFNDLGRDFLVMYDWQATGKPPLLGPQTSTIAFNQSAWYFYVLYPFYLLFSQSLFSTTYAMLFYSLGLFAITYALIRMYASELTTSFFFFFFLSAVHPELVAQQRFVWNPSFVLPALTVTLFGLFVLQKAWKSWLVWLVSAGMSFAISMSYSAVPVLVGFFLSIGILWRKRLLLFIVAFATSLLFWNAPTIFFELRHNFLLTNMVTTRGSLPQMRSDIPSKLQAYGTYLFSTETVRSASVMFSIFILVLIVARTTIMSPWKKEFSMTSLILLGSLAATLISPFDIQPHYIFPILTLIFGLVAFLPMPAAGVLVIGAALYWLNPQHVLKYTEPALRTVKQIEHCAQTVCAQEKQPMFVSEQAGFHVFHTGPEYRFLFKKYGCDIRSIETNPSLANRMAVVVDNSIYEHGKTAYNELTLFGPSTAKNKYVCEGNIQVVMLQKKDSYDPQ
ncbi:MAG TPA: hypothetical protein VJ246_04000 [Patescibacteria group bacterium]|nr:hypothetical protein [Patescibacteria group bacterium]